LSPSKAADDKNPEVFLLELIFLRQCLIVVPTYPLLDQWDIQPGLDHSDNYRENDFLARKKSF